MAQLMFNHAVWVLLWLAAAAIVVTPLAYIGWRRRRERRRAARPGFEVTPGGRRP